MVERVKDHIWQSIHTDYLEFAILSCQSCQESPSELNPGVHIKRNVTDPFVILMTALRLLLNLSITWGD